PLVRIAVGISRHKPCKQAPSEVVELRQYDPDQSEGAHPAEDALKRRAEGVDWLVMPALWAVELQDVALAAAHLRQAVQAVAAPLAENRQFFPQAGAVQHLGRGLGRWA